VVVFVSAVAVEGAVEAAAGAVAVVAWLRGAEGERGELLRKGRYFEASRGGKGWKRGGGGGNVGRTVGLDRDRSG
jgi:hypothetical protein